MAEQERRAFIDAISFEGDIEDCDGVLMFTVKKDFDLAAAFQSVYTPTEGPPPFRIGVPYCIADDMIWYTMELYFESPSGLDENNRVFPLSDRERDCLKDKVYEYCQQLTGMSLLEYGLLHWPEDDGPDDWPEPESAELARPLPSEGSASWPISGFDLMEMYAMQCIDEMAAEIKRRVTPEKWERIVAEAQQYEEQPDAAPKGPLDFTGPSM